MLPPPSTLLTVGSETGHIFKGQFPGSFCFVPRQCLETDRFREDLYLARWAHDNALYTETTRVGSMLYPRLETGPIDIETNAQAKDFYQRITARFKTEDDAT